MRQTTITTEAQFCNFKLVHQLKSRVRIIAPCLRKDPLRCYILEILLLKRLAIEKVKIVSDIASVTICFDSAQLPKENLLNLLDAVLGNIGVKSNDAISELSKHTVDASTPEAEINFAVGGMSCASCALFLEMILLRDYRITQANVNFVTETATVKGRLGKDMVFELINQHGYTAYPMDTLAERKLIIEIEKQHISKTRKRLLYASIFSIPVIVLGAGFSSAPKLRLLQALFASPVVFWGGMPFFNKALKLARQRTVNMDTLIAMGVSASYGYSLPAIFRRSQHAYFEAASGIIVFVLLGRYLEERAKAKASEEIRKLVDMQPQQATLLRDGEESNISVEQIKEDDVLLVRPGEKIPADGEVIKGLSVVDESIVTGSGIPVVKEIGHKLVSGCVNGSGALQMRATAVGKDTLLSGIVHMVDQAQAKKLAIQKTVDRVATVFVPGIMLTSALTFVGWLFAGVGLGHAFGSAVTVLLIACPCALGLATPAATMVGTGQAARRGIYIRSSHVLETVAGVTAVVFDKTGTITEGKSRVTDMLNISDRDNMVIIGLAASAEFNSEHVLGRAILAHAKEAELRLKEASHFHSFPDKGIRATVDNLELLLGNESWLTEQKIDLSSLSHAAGLLADQGKIPVFMAINNQPAALFGIVDQIRSNAGAVLKQLQEKGIHTLMITGDIEKSAAHTARKLNIDVVIAEASPAKKLQTIQQLQEQGFKVAMIGDGINDAPALAAADVGLAIGTGTDIAIETADLILVNGDLAKVAEAIELSENTFKIIKQNLFWAFGYNMTAVPIAVMGKLNPLIASGAMALSSVSVIANSLRLYRK